LRSLEKVANRDIKEAKKPTNQKLENPGEPIASRLRAIVLNHKRVDIGDVVAWLNCPCLIGQQHTARIHEYTCGGRCSTTVPGCVRESLAIIPLENVCISRDSKSSPTVLSGELLQEQSRYIVILFNVCDGNQVTWLCALFCERLGVRVGFLEDAGKAWKKENLIM